MRLLYFIALLFPICTFSQSLEVSYLTGGSASLYTQNPGHDFHLLQLKNSVIPFPNFVGEASIGYNFYKEKINVSIAYNQLVYSYKLKAAYIYPEFFAKRDLFQFFSATYNNVVSTSIGYNFKIKPKIIFRPYLSLYMGFNRGISSSGSGEYIQIPRDDSTISVGKVTFEDNINFRTSVLFGIGYKFNFYVTRWLFLTVGSRYTRGFRKDFTAILKIEVDGETYETQKVMRSSNFSIDLGLGVKLNIAKNANR